MKPLYVWWDRNFSGEFQKQLLRALDNIIELHGSPNDIKLNVLGNFSNGRGEYNSADWYFDTSYESRRRQVNTDSVFRKCVVEPWQTKSPHYEVIGTSYDLWSGDANNNFVYGATIPDFGTMTSSNRMVKYYGQNAPLVYFILAMHEGAHLFGAPDETKRGDIDYTFGPHCRLADCTLGQVNVKGRPDALTAARNILNRYKNTGSYFCKECADDITRSR